MDPIIRLVDVGLRFGKVHALKGLSLEVRPGAIYGFLGRNGAGKTTTLRVLMGLFAPDRGSLELFGEKVRRVSTKLKARIGYVSQEQAYYPWMTAQTLGRFVGDFYPTWDPTFFKALLSRLDIPVDRRAVELSGGTRTKLGLALALASRPALLLLDEPTAGLDPVARREFNDLVAAMARDHGTTVFFSSHLVAEVEQIADHVGILQAGQLEFEGEVALLRRTVRRLQASEPLTPPPGFARLRDDLYRAPPEDWEQTVWPEGVFVQDVSLEEAFLAFARTDRTA